MVRFVIYVLVSILLAISSKVSAQNDGQNTFETKEYSQFDFWLSNCKGHKHSGVFQGTSKEEEIANAFVVQRN